MSMEWLWFSQACATSGIKMSQFSLPKNRRIPAYFFHGRLPLSIFIIYTILFSFVSYAAVIESGPDIQAAVALATTGDTIIVGPGNYDPFTVNKMLSIQGIGDPVVHARVQTPGITIRASRVNISGFQVKGVSEDADAKYNYYMDSLSTKGTSNQANLAVLNLPNAAILVEGKNVCIRNSSVRGAEVGVLVKDGDGISFWNCTFQGCDSGIELQDCNGGKIEFCRYSDNEKYGIYIEESRNIDLVNNDITTSKNIGAMLKKSSGCAIEENQFSGNWEGLVLWNSSFNYIRGNCADNNYYYGMLIASGSNNNTVLENSARDNGGGAVSIFGVGISVGNSSYNVIAGNELGKSLNGLELMDGSEFNIAYCNHIFENHNGIRADKTQNNLIYGNNLEQNLASAYDNASHNFWNASFGNYYSDYSGLDNDGDDIGDTPYWIPKGDSCVADWHPLVEPCNCSTIEPEAIKGNLRSYATYIPEDDTPYRIENDMIVISSKPPERWQF